LGTVQQLEFVSVR